MHRFFISDITPAHTDFILPEEESKHACRVLRLSNGDSLEIINGRGDLLTATITDAHAKHCVVHIENVLHEEPESFSIHIGIAPTKNIDRLEWFVEKATEIGVHAITPVFGENSERRQLKPERLEKIIVAATKQSMRLHAPVLHPAQKVSDFLKSNPGQYIAHCDSGKPRIELHTLRPQQKEITLLIGPEGDFSANEITLAQQNEYTAVSLGNTRLRTETAGVYAVTVLKTLFA
jgi:16S rRNA (uracil1498-N3)-methyltransferase